MYFQWISIIVGVSSVCLNAIQFFRKRSLLTAFRAQMSALNGQLSLAVYSAKELREHTQSLAKPTRELDPGTIRAISILSGDMCGYAQAICKHVQDSSRAYLHFHLPTWQQVLQQFNANPDANTEQSEC